MAALVDAMAAGEVTPEEAATISGVLEARRRALETQELADRVDRLEQEMKSR
jgi:ubiquinone biosynthesis protein UbiJ